MEVVIQQVTLAPPPPRNYVPDLPKPIEELILTAIEKDPDERFQSMREFIDAIQQAKEVGSGGKQRKVQISTTRQILAIAGGICILVALLGSGIWYSTKHNMPTNTPKTSIASTEITATAPTIEALISTELAPQAPTAIPTIEINELVTPYPTVASEFFSFPPYPQLAGTALPTTSEAITAQNASKIIEILRLGNPVNHTIVWSPNEEFIYMGTESGIYIFPTKGKQPQYMIDARGAITSLAISSDAKLLAAGGRNGLIQIFEAHTGKTVFELPGHTNEVRTLNFSADGLRLISGSKDGTARVWDLSLGSELLKLSGHGSNINDAEFTPDGAYAITGSDDYSIRIWDTATGTPKAKLDVNGIVNDLEVSHDGKMVAAAMNDPRVELWSLETNRRLLTLKDTNLLTPIYGIGLSPNSRLVAVAAGDGRLRIFNTLNGEMLNNFLAAGDEKNPIAVTRAIYSANGTQLLVESADGLITQWNLTAQQIIHTIEFPAEKVEKFAVSPDGKILAVQEGNTNLILYSLEYGTKLGSIDGWLPEGSPFHTESKKLAVVRKDGLYLLSLSGTGQRLGLFPNDSTVAFTSDGKRLIIAGERRIELWITETGLRGVAGSLEFEGNCQSAYTDHGDYIASGMRFLAINNRDFADFACQVKRDPRTLDTSMAVPNTVVFALNDGTGQVWVKGDNPMPRLLGGGTGRAQAVAVTSDGTLIALGGEDSQIRIYDTQGTIVATLNHHTSDILDLHFTEDKQMLISLSEDGTIEVWGLVSQEK